MPGPWRTGAASAATGPVLCPAAVASHPTGRQVSQMLHTRVGTEGALIDLMDLTGKSEQAIRQ